MKPNRTYGWLLVLLLNLLVGTPATVAQTLSVGGTGSSEPIVRLLFDEFRKEVPGATLNHLSPPLGSGGALKALAANRIGVAFIGRPVQPEEARRIGQSFLLAETPFVVASRDARQKDGFTLDQLARIYTGELTTWRDGSPVRLILRPRFESDSAQLKSMSPAMEKAVDAAAQRPGMVTADNDLEALKLISETPGSLGSTTLGLLTSGNSRAVPLPINGVAPSLATLKNGSYPWRKPLIVALPQQPDALAERFAAFLRSSKARNVLQRHDYLPATQ
ncbi:MAG TPA: substrate-binding domain-containing protein [Accumulibacter sp.]|uniref:PstS family phosphate ABC transporter substrate-binding protein n=1 Tax=Accumulibacter sp. TaxID=2053492 RepID=UPI002BEEE9F7|nr:substrate-binding domain-containing protein [Accumulibacter sp.]HMX70019.1 substrate-binding domain-containing protein [Accumulibacter sp.]HNE38948.1 substrate-binding domain-containing protein [Accumulibacter sp.]HNG16288.1 substrate-binding domain-containing protein [Accumulibacter sp.]HNH92078.1 substrate-binding domain-containing protein [Accumulibacter sp.]HNK03514.1 substrate-binding domain-containing protein [Accumulibacter sp.]